MRVLILTPSVYPSLTGNAITTERWRHSLAAKGLDIAVLPVTGLDSPALAEILRSFRPDLIHAYHAFKAGTLILNNQVTAGTVSLPLVVSPGGTDINLDFNAPEKRESIVQVLRTARVVVAQSSGIVNTIREQIPELIDKIVTVPKACSWIGEEPYDLRKAAGCKKEDTLFFLPAGIRPVKGNLECLLAIERVHRLRPQMRFVAAGPAIDAAYAEKFKREIERLSSFARWIPAIPPASMRSAYNTCDFVLNASFSEGLSNCLLEALSAGKPFLASDVPGNRQPILCGEAQQRPGWYYDPCNTEEFVSKMIQLIDDPGLRHSLSTAALLQKSKLPTPEQEADGLIKAYTRALKK